MVEIVCLMVVVMVVVGILFVGVFYVGLMLMVDGLKLIEYNVCFGDLEM